MVIASVIVGYYQHLANLELILHALAAQTEINFECIVAEDDDCAELPTPNAEGKIENEWFVHQLYTTANFCMDNAVVSFFTGGLNFQIEHHLFPMISHVHYPDIAPIVEKTAKEFGVPYQNNPSLTGALGGHVQYLWNLGNGKDQVLQAAL
jgi:linoleoyl-CoA desaturase